MLLSHLLRGVVSTLTFTSSPLYRYPYRSAAEAFRGDAKRIGGDITGAIRKLQETENE